MDKLPVKRLRRDKISFNNLPDEIIHKIFRILDRNSLKNCSLINKRCSEIIATSSILMRNFKLKLTSNVWTSKWKINEILNLQRHIQIIEISDCDGCHSVLTGICKNLGMNVRSLTLEKSQIDDFTLREMLRNADSLESLSLAEVTIIKKLPTVNPVSLRKLKVLRIYNCDWSILKFITAQISSLSVKSYLDEGLRLHLVNFMLQQYQLTELSLRGTSIRALFQRDDIIKDCNFSLESFHIEQDFGKHSDNVNWRVTAFMSLH